MSIYINAETWWKVAISYIRIRRFADFCQYSWVCAQQGNVKDVFSRIYAHLKKTSSISCLQYYVVKRIVVWVSENRDLQKPFRKKQIIRKLVLFASMAYMYVHNSTKELLKWNSYFISFIKWVCWPQDMVKPISFHANCASGNFNSF